MHAIRPVMIETCRIRRFQNNWEILCLCYFGNHTKDDSCLIGSYIFIKT